MAPTAPRLRPELLEHLRPLTVFTRSWNCLLMVTFSLEVHAGMDSTLSLCPELLNKCLLSIGLSRCGKRGGKEKSRHDCVPTTCQACTRASYHHVGGAVPTARLLLEQAWDMRGAGGQTDQKYVLTTLTLLKVLSTEHQNPWLDDPSQAQPSLHIGTSSATVA